MKNDGDDNQIKMTEDGENLSDIIKQEIENPLTRYIDKVNVGDTVMVTGITGKSHLR